jgi:hypothetical protein
MDTNTATIPVVCYHPRSCRRCDRSGRACGAHKVGSTGHEQCTGKELAAHLLPTSCHVCGTPTREGATRPACAHDYTNAEASAAADEHDRRVRLARTPEAAYVAEHRPY